MCCALEPWSTVYVCVKAVPHSTLVSSWRWLFSFDLEKNWEKTNETHLLLVFLSLFFEGGTLIYKVVKCKKTNPQTFSQKTINICTFWGTNCALDSFILKRQIIIGVLKMCLLLGRRYMTKESSLANVLKCIDTWPSCSSRSRCQTSIRRADTIRVTVLVHEFVLMRRGHRDHRVLSYPAMQDLVSYF